MAKPVGKSNKTVTRVVANKDNPSQKSKPSKSVVKKAAPTEEIEKKGIIRGFFGYFTGAWRELRAVHWPNRRSTWSLTFAVLVFSGFFVLFILLLDALFKQLFDIILK